MSDNSRMVMRVVVVGAGRLATCLAPALKQSGVEVVQVWSRTKPSAETLASELGCDAAWGGAEGLCREADMYLVCVRDDAVAAVAGMVHSVVPDAIIAHTAGAVAMEALTRCGHRHCGVFYPLQSFSKGRVIDFARVHFFIEATDTPTQDKLTMLATRLTETLHIHHLDFEARRRLHLAAVFVSNFVNHCCTLSQEVLRPAGLDFEVLRPLLDETIAKLETMSPTEAQTGPARRGDETVMDEHRSLLADEPHLLEIYNCMSESIKSHYDRL